MRLTNPHNSPGETTSFTPPTPAPAPVGPFVPFGDPGVFTVDNLLVEFIPPDVGGKRADVGVDPDADADVDAVLGWDICRIAVRWNVMSRLETRFVDNLGF
jgi:hypothetical protein